MIRQLIEAFARELRMLKRGHALSGTDAAAYAMLEVVQRRRVTVPADCPLPECSTCPSLDVVAEEQRARDLAYTSAWLVERYPDAWYFEGTTDLARFSAGVLDLKIRVEAGIWKP